jgi:hypothetical protein
MTAAGTTFNWSLLDKNFLVAPRLCVASWKCLVCVHLSLISGAGTETLPHLLCSASMPLLDIKGRLMQKKKKNFLAVLGIEHRALCLLGKCFAFSYFSGRVSHYCHGPSSDHNLPTYVSHIAGIILHTTTPRLLVEMGSC